MIIKEIAEWITMVWFRTSYLSPIYIFALPDRMEIQGDLEFHDEKDERVTLSVWDSLEGWKFPFNYIPLEFMYD